MCWSVRKYHTTKHYEILHLTFTPYLYTLPLHRTLLTRCGYAIVERIAMSKPKVTDDLLSPINKRSNTSHDYVFYTSASKRKLKIVSPTKVGKRPIYKFFIEFEGTYFP